jgi:acylpyruvate hydrolase
MKLATIRTATGTTAARIERDVAVELSWAEDVSALLTDPQWRERAATADGPRRPIGGVQYSAAVPRPSKIFCVGLNYRSHIAEIGLEPPQYPTLFAKFADTLLGPYDPLQLPPVSTKVDWEVELGAVIGTPVRRAGEAEAEAAIAGYLVANDISVRDWQMRTSEWMQGKVFEASTPVGPWLVTPEDVDGAGDLDIWCEVDGTTMQRSRTSDLLVSPAGIVAYISQIITLRPGDLILTGTPGGVGFARDPEIYLRPGQVVRAGIEGLGEVRNVCAQSLPTPSSTVP